MVGWLGMALKNLIYHNIACNLQKQNIPLIINFSSIYGLHFWKDGGVVEK